MDKTTEQKHIEEQNKQIKKLVAASIQMEKRLLLLDKKVARQAHTIQNQTNVVNTILRTLHKRSS